MVTKDEILDYVMNTPGNTNRAVLESLVDNLEDTKPTVSLCKINTTNDANAHIYYSGMVLVEVDNGDIIYIPDTSIPNGVCDCIPSKDNDDYYYSITITGNNIDAVIINNTSVEYNSKAGAYIYTYRDLHRPETITIFVSSDEH